MTGYGKAHADVGSRKITVQIKSLNSKQLDFYLRSPALYKDKELEIRSLVSDSAERGKVELTLQSESSSEESNLAINKELFRAYYNELKSLSGELGETTDLMGIISKFPEVLHAKNEELSEAEWDQLQQLIKQALEDFNAFRQQEGGKLEEDIRNRIGHIMTYLAEVSVMEGDRITTVRNRIDKNMNAFLETDKINQDRFEQEMIYYLEKIDITEEKTRLQAHCEYFLETMIEKGSPGKKLGFISQEIGREINTIGSKANHAGIQKIVVQMKDELEKIKEQLLNVL